MFFLIIRAINVGPAMEIGDFLNEPPRQIWRFRKSGSVLV